jgi:hypothetical protein
MRITNLFAKGVPYAAGFHPIELKYESDFSEKNGKLRRLD